MIPSPASSRTLSRHSTSALRAEQSRSFGAATGLLLPQLRRDLRRDVGLEPLGPLLIVAEVGLDRAECAPGAGGAGGWRSSRVGAPPGGAVWNTRNGRGDTT